MTSPVGVPARPRPCSATEAVQRALSLVGQGGQYLLGTGGYRPTAVPDLPWTELDGELGSDCAGFAISWCYKLPRHRPGYNHGVWSTVEDDLNCNSAIEDADHAGELWERVLTPAPGCLILYPTIRLQGHPQPWIGHVKIVTGVTRCTTWDGAAPDWSLLDTVECCGPNHRQPAVVAGTGATMLGHDRLWPRAEHRTMMLRAKS